MRKIFVIFIILALISLIMAFSFYKIKKGIAEISELTMARERLVRLLKTYTAYDKNEPLKLARYGKKNDGGYVVPIKALQNSDVLLGYGIADDNSFEEDFSKLYGKPSYGFDCGITNVITKSRLFTFINQCIADDKFLFDSQISSGNFSSFTQQLHDLKLIGKKIFIKMDIEGKEYQAFKDILKYQADITGIALEIHFKDKASTLEAVNLLATLNKYFVLLHVHGNNYSDPGFSAYNAIGVIPDAIELTYINKALLSNYSPSQDQSHPQNIDMPNDISKPDVQFEILT